jgi:hypothetical protein
MYINIDIYKYTYILIYIYSFSYDSLLPGAESEITLQLTAPELTGRHVAYFRMRTSEGAYFGQRLWADIRVTEDEQVYIRIYIYIYIYMYFLYC